MGYTRHDAIIVTGFDANEVREAHDYAVEIGCLTSEIVKGAINGYESFFIAPDGSKEGWAESEKGDEQRKNFIAWLRENRGKPFWLDWIAINFGGDDSQNASITDHHGQCADEEQA